MNHTPKPIYERKIWQVLKKAAKELALAIDHCPVKKEYSCHRHIETAEKILTDYVLEDMKQAEKCQREKK